jgi:hypothetical protein
MADVVYSTDPLTGLYKDHSDIRREGVEHTNEIIKEGIKGDFNSVMATKDARHDILDSTGAEADRLSNQASSYFIANQQYQFDAARDVAALKSTTDMAFAKMASDIATQSALGQAASALESAKVAAAVALGQAQLERSINADGNETRKLINELKISELERKLIERNADILDGRYEARHWRGNYDNAQFAALTSQMQAFNSQLSATRSDMVNFGTMTGVTSSANTNQVR